MLRLYHLKMTPTMAIFLLLWSCSGGGGGGGGTSFFGISSSGSRFCYIVDMSGSMSSGNRMGQAINELTQSIKKLPDFARFYVLFYSAGVREPSIQRGWNTARKRTVDKMIEEFAQIKPKGGTEPRDALVKQFKTLLSMDNVELSFDEDAVEAIAKEAYKRKTGARALRGIVEEIMLDLMYSLPSQTKIKNFGFFGK